MHKELISFCFLVGSCWYMGCQKVTAESTTLSPDEYLDILRHVKSHHSINNSMEDTRNRTILRMVTVCNTPNDDEGYCMPLKNCTMLMNQLENINAQNFLKQSKCGPKSEKDSTNPSVCCGKYDNYKNLTRITDNPFPKNCGYQKFRLKSRIVGGKEASLGEFPWMARLIHKKNARKTFGCAGFLITPTFVLTAGHCLDSENIKILGPIFEVQLGEHNTETKIDCDKKNVTCADEPQIIRVKKRIVHPNYNKSSNDHQNDIGLIHLKKAASITDFVSIICLLEKYDFTPFEYWISGWGSTRHKSISSIKMKVSLPPFPHFNCTQMYNMVGVHVIDSQICAGGQKNKDSCTGDSGGPLMLVKDKNHWFAAGIVSFGLGCGKQGWPGIYTNTTSFLPWIQKTIIKRITLKGKRHTKS